MPLRALFWGKMEKLDRFQVAGEACIDIFGSEIKVESQCLEIAERPAPHPPYSSNSIDPFSLLC